MSKLSIGVIGTGSIGNAHLEGYAAQPDKVRIQALCDVNIKRLKFIADKYGVAPEHCYTRHQEMLKSEKLGAVSVCTPNLYHYECAADSIRAGIPTLIEKPMVVTMQQARALTKLVARKKVKTMVAFSHRFISMNIAAKKLLSKGVIGKPYMVRVRYAHGGPYPGWAQSDWFYKKDIAIGGALLDMGIHAIDICQYLVGPIKSVAAEMRTLRKKIEVDDNAIMLLDFAPLPCLGYIEVGWTSKAGFSGIEICGDNGVMTLDLANGPTVTRGIVKPDGTRQLTTEPIEVPEGPSHWPFQMVSWVKHVTGKKTDTAIPGVEEGLSSLAVGLAAMESSKLGRRIAVKR